jgi:hypothetical protein
MNRMQLYRCFFLALLTLVLQSCFITRQIFTSSPSSDPSAAKFITTDVENFWKAYDIAREAIQKGDTQTVVKTFESLYFAKATLGLQDFEALRIRSRENFAKTIMKSNKYYDTIRVQALKVRDLDSAIRQPFFTLKKIYPESVFPDIYFVIGMLSSGGTLSGTGLLIGTEFYSLPANLDKNTFLKNPWLRSVTQSSDQLKYIIAHELIHSQQPSAQFSGVRERTLLEQSLREGAADFVSELIAGATINNHVREFANPREKELWKEFQSVMNGTDYSRWLYNGSNSTDRPADLGYWIGYQICKAYYGRTADKHEALKAILTTNDAAQFLKASAYAESLAKMP